MYGRDIRNRSEENSRCMTNINRVERYIMVETIWNNDRYISTQ